MEQHGSQAGRFCNFAWQPAQAGVLITISHTSRFQPLLGQEAIGRAPTLDHTCQATETHRHGNSQGDCHMGDKPNAHRRTCQCMRATRAQCRTHCAPHCVAAITPSIVALRLLRMSLHDNASFELTSTQIFQKGVRLPLTSGWDGVQRGACKEPVRPLPPAHRPWRCTATSCKPSASPLRRSRVLLDLASLTSNSCKMWRKALARPPRTLQSLEAASPLPRPPISKPTSHRFESAAPCAPCGPTGLPQRP